MSIRLLEDIHIWCLYGPEVGLEGLTREIIENNTNESRKTTYGNFDDPAFIFVGILIY